MSFICLQIFLLIVNNKLSFNFDIYSAKILNSILICKENNRLYLYQWHFLNTLLR